MTSLSRSFRRKNSVKESKKILSDNLFPVVGIGASAGGLNAFRHFIKAIPDQSGMAYVLVQHLDPNHDSLLPDLLQKVTTIPVLEIADDVKVQPNHIYILPSNKMLVANDGVLQLSPRTTKKGELNLPIDLFFTSLAAIHHHHAIGVVLSGTGNDGTNGLKAIKANAGITFAQDEASAMYPGMPRSAVRAGVVDYVLPPGEMPRKLQEVARSINEVSADSSPVIPTDNDVFGQILSLLRARRKTDFTYYKQTTIRRRILRRIAINKNETPAEYLQYLRENPLEQDALYQDLLISVTSFFRDHTVFDNLCETVFPRIAQKAANKPIRVWVAGCSTGEEAYSIAMCFSEYLGTKAERVQIFASDLSEQAVAKARTGLYTKAEVNGVSAKRLLAFFTKTQGSYQINKSVRAMCVFASHNFLTDPPFSKMDFISCRNVLIYMNTYLQKKVLTTFHYALNPTGFLLLGKSETIGGVPDLFAAIAKNEKLFSRKDTPTRFIPVDLGRKELTLQPIRQSSETKSMKTDFQKAADELILSNYSPVGVIVNESLDIVHFRGNTSNYLEQSSGKPTHNLLLMAKNGLAFELRNTLHKVKKEKIPVSKENILVEVNGHPTNITIDAIPLPNTIEPHYLVLFHSSPAVSAKSTRGNRKTANASEKDDKDRRILQLEQELVQLRDDMRSITEDQEAANEELQSANEELLSGNEELQSLNEEVESSKEELQSTNEELTVVNQEMSSLNEQVTAARDYAEAIIANIREPLLVLNSNLRIKLANQSFYKTFRVSEVETEGMLVYDLGNRQWNIPQLRTLLEHILPEKSTFSDFEITHNFATIGERVMLLNAREIVDKKSADRLILLSIEDITETAKAREVEQQATRRFQFIANSMPLKVWTADAVGNMDYFNQSWYEYTGLSFDDLKDWGWIKNVHPDDRKKTRTCWQQSIDSGSDFEIEHRFMNAAGDYKWHLSRAVAYKDKSDQITMWIGTNTEIQEQTEQKEQLEKAVVCRTQQLRLANETLGRKNDELKKINKELESFTYVSSHDLQEPLRKLQTLANSILDKESQNLSVSGKDAFRRLQKSAERMQHLIQDLLAFSKLSSPELPRETIDPALVLKEVIKDLSESIDEKHAIIDATDLCPVTVVAFQFRQLLTNLIGNALKFSNPAVPPHIRITCVLAKGSDLPNGLLVSNETYYHLTVADNGIGFDPKYDEKIFDVFQRLHRKEQYDGTGIGLAIVKKIVENHNGIIVATGELTKGARFDMYLPTPVAG
ncbi:CheR family methyltransferase [Fibrivirga algicola]|uniref:histidine kinase n=1 Tax=Fibrivirga algicola TaxID=2950420 RepID=A0ABX0QMW4_9BACT|nr:CheR family methyltransferase [Fibrivirga algicola]NID13467.1 PAS domain-containing protein [Fibrivirga algicola]